MERPFLCQKAEMCIEVLILAVVGELMDFQTGVGSVVTLVKDQDVVAES